MRYLRIIILFLSLNIGMVQSQNSAEQSLQLISRDNLWQLEPIHSIALGDSYIRDVSWSPDGSLLGISSDNILTLYDANSMSVVNQFVGDNLIISRISFSPDSERVVTVGGGITSVPQENPVPSTIHIWDITTGETLQQIVQGENEPIILPVMYTPEDTILTLTFNSTIFRRWDVETGELLEEEVLELPVEGWAQVISEEFSPYGTYLGIGGLHNEFSLWRLAPEIEQIETTVNLGAALVFSPDESKFAISNRYGGFSQIHFLNENREPVETSWFNATYIDAVDFTPDGSMLVQAVHADFISTINIFFWDVYTGELFHSLQIVDFEDNESYYDYLINHLVINPQGTMMVTIDESNLMTVWAVPES